ncbi:PAS domain S-box-containing protein [Sphingopyxis terrae subsp. ummariensis]|uniref:histidine kinase n=2 Tax=Sphingopyxis terrae TaxID=33052 RepID=A0A1Y6FSR4_9SPHN|nr:PAS domain S-box-containing protein [Sphingopyxis terrae subsp. ummariensis]
MRWRRCQLKGSRMARSLKENEACRDAAAAIDVLAAIDQVLAIGESQVTDHRAAYRCLGLLIELTGARQGAIALHDPAGDALLTLATQSSYSAGSGHYGPDRGSAPRIFKNMGRAAQILAGDAVIDNGGSELALGNQTDEAWRVTSLLGFPLRQGGKPRGVLLLADRPDGFLEAQLGACRQLAPAIASVIAGAGTLQALQRTEHWLETLVDGMPQLVWRARDTGAWSWSSRQWQAFTGQSAEQSRGSGWLAAVHPEDREPVRRAWTRALQDDRFEADHRLYHAEDADYRWVQSRAHAVRECGGRCAEWIGTTSDIDDLRRLQHRQQRLACELQHRVRNMLTIIRSVYDRSMESGGDPEELASHFRGRLDNLARTQVIVMQSADGKVDLETIIRDELLSAAAHGRISLAGPEVALPAAVAEPLGLAIHELTTNAIKFGALRFAASRLDIAWAVTAAHRDTPKLTLEWREHAVPAVPLAPIRRGFGLELIEKAIPYRLSARSTVDFAPGGIGCRIILDLPASEGDGRLAATK